MTKRQRLRAALICLVIIGALAIQLATRRPLPACDNAKAKATLAALYDNKRLLPATDATALRQISESTSHRYCVARVTWRDGTQTDIAYEYDRSGKSGRSISMWINHNGGQHGPSY